MSKKYVIFGGIDTNVDDQPMYWGPDGWGFLSTAIIYTEEECTQFPNLPTYSNGVTAVWVELPILPEVSITETPEKSWASDDQYPVEDWQYEVANNDTRLGYLEWLESKKRES